MLDGWMNYRHYVSTLYKYEKHIITSAYTPVCVCIDIYLHVCVLGLLCLIFIVRGVIYDHASRYFWLIK